MPWVSGGLGSGKLCGVLFEGWLVICCDDLRCNYFVLVLLTLVWVCYNIDSAWVNLLVCLCEFVGCCPSWLAVLRCGFVTVY